MQRVVTYSILGFCLGVALGPLVTSSVVVACSLGVAVGVAGGALGMWLNRIIDPNNHGDIDNWISYARTRLP
jgi:hypothetical protein